MKTEHIEKHPNDDLTFSQMLQMKGEPVFDFVSRCWLIVESVTEGLITFSDGTSITDDTKIIKGRFYAKWQDYTLEQICTRAIIRQTESYEDLASGIMNSDRYPSEKRKIVQTARNDVENMLAQENLTEKNKELIRHSLICIDTILTIIDLKEDDQHAE